MTKTLWNNRGSRTEMTINPGGGQDSAILAYDYDADNQLIELAVDAPGRQHLAQFLYNGDGLRVEKTVIGNLTVGGSQQYYSYTKRYLMDGVDVLLEKQVLSETSEIVTSLYIPGIMLITVTGENELVIRYFLHDALGNVIALTDPNQEITAVYQYDGWGNVLVSPELQQVVSLTSNPVPTEVIHNPYRWGGAWGYYMDEDAGLYLLGLRWYESFTGKFLTRDPIGFGAGDPNKFRPMGNNPVNEVDPTGLFDPLTWLIILLGSAAVGGGAYTGWKLKKLQDNSERVRDALILNAEVASDPSVPADVVDEVARMAQSELKGSLTEIKEFAVGELYNTYVVGPLLDAGGAAALSILELREIAKLAPGLMYEVKIVAGGRPGRWVYVKGHWRTSAQGGKVYVPAHYRRYPGEVGTHAPPRNMEMYPRGESWRQ